MNWIAPYRDTIMAEAALLGQNGFSWIGEDANCIKFTDGEIVLTFCVQRYEEALEVLVSHLGGSSSHEEYRLDLVMRTMGDATTQDFINWSKGDRRNLVSRYVRYIVDNKQRLFGPHCTYATAYEDFNRKVMEQLMAQWAKKP